MKSLSDTVKSDEVQPQADNVKFPSAQMEANNSSIEETPGAIKTHSEDHGEKQTPRCAVCGESILADEPLGSADAEQWSIYNATHDRLCLKHFRIEYEKLKLRWRLQDVERRLVCAGVSVKFSNRSFDNFVLNESNRHLFSIVKQWSDHPYSFLSILSKHTGIGKTHLAIASLRQYYISTGVLGRFRKERDVLLQIRKGYVTHSSPTEDEIIESLSKPDLLVIDDLFSFVDSKEGKEFARRIALAITDEREWQGRTTIVTGNLTLSDIASIDPRIASRLSAGLVLNVQSVDKDFRPSLHKPALNLSKGQNSEAPNE